MIGTLISCLVFKISTSVAGSWAFVVVVEKVVEAVVVVLGAVVVSGH